MDFEKIGKFIKELREAANMSQNDLAKKVFVEKSNVSRWEAGKSSISPNNLVAITKIFQISLDELVAGHRFESKKGEDIAEEKQQVLVDVMKNRNKFFKIAKICVIGIVLILLVFLIYFFYTFYNSVSVYSIHTNNDEINIEYGSLTKMRDRIYFYLELSDNIENVKSINLYYEINGERKKVIKQNNLSTIRIIDYYDYEEYFDFSSFNKIIKNMYLEVELDDGTLKNYKLDFDRNYANIDFFLKKGKSNSKTKKDDNTDSINEISEDINKAMEILNSNKGVMNVKVDGVEYEVHAIQNGINIIFRDGTFNLMYYYINDNPCKFICKRNINNQWENLYSKIIQDSNCEDEYCERFLDDYEKFIKIIDNLNIYAN